MTNTLRKTAITLGAISALGLGGATIAGAADKTPAKTTQQRPAREALAADVAAKVKAAALAKVPGATVVRTEAGGPYTTAYHAHIKTTDGTSKVVLVNAAFEATDVVADQGRGAGKGNRNGKSHGGPRGNETALTGDTKTKVEAAVLAKYAGATILRSETNGDADAPYEAHITTTDGKQLEVLVGSDFTVLDARERPAKR